MDVLHSNRIKYQICDVLQHIDSGIRISETSIAMATFSLSSLKSLLRFCVCKYGSGLDKGVDTTSNGDQGNNRESDETDLPNPNESDCEFVEIKNRRDRVRLVLGFRRVEVSPD
ncbi:hypothetical protein LOK49_LG07G03042 [Camellia lanceoleosa]|uniref:Uncharacterized protein n=1 Tax=Camellia lanceoleosa TaxID=1840588 RepID=A0ACC0H8I0_9ERIC|nr:hypothetical protein LOK49_LG07G03042 [Camellia lanceoleosa]